MKCRIDIKEGLIKQVIDKYETRSIARTGKNTLFVSNTAFRSGKAQAYQVAQNTVNRINKEYEGLMAHRREVVGGQEILIDPSNNLVSIYYNDYLKAFPGYTESKPLAVKTGVEQLFESFPELSKIGTPEQYSEYLDSLFPNSKVKDIVYHLTDKKFEDIAVNRDGFVYFTGYNNINAWKQIYKNSTKREFVYTIPYVIDTQYGTFLKKDQVERDEVFGDPAKSVFKKKGLFETTITDAKKAVRLGSKQNIEGFKEFVSTTSDQKIRSEQAPFEAQVKYVKRYGAEIKSGVSELFESNLELASIGTPEQYTAYLDTIFPDSKVKDIVYHGTDLSKEQIDFKTDRGGIFLASSPIYASYFSKQENAYPALINFNNIYQAKGLTDNIGKEEISQIKSKRFDSVVGKGGISKMQQHKNDLEYIAFKPEQVHILGSKQDVKGFREFLSLKSSEEEDARKIQEEDAKRAGIKYGDRYLFEEERPDAYFDYEKELLASTDTPVEQNIFEELSNLNFTNEVIEYLYNDSSKRLSIEKFAETVKMFAANLRGMGYTNEEVLEHIKCL